MSVNQTEVPQTSNSNQARFTRRNRRPFNRESDKEWVPVTKLGKLVKEGKITSLEDIYLYSNPIKEYQMVDKIIGTDNLKDTVMNIQPVQKQTRAGQRTRFKAIVCIGDGVSHVGIGVKCAKDVASAIKGAIVIAKLSIIPIRKGYWGSKYSKPHTVPQKVTGKCGSVTVRLIPAPRGSGIVAADASKKILSLAGYQDVYTTSKGSTRTMENFVKATYRACRKTYTCLSPDLWTNYSEALGMAPLQKFSNEFLNSNDKIPQNKQSEKDELLNEEDEEIKEALAPIDGLDKE